MIFKKITTAMFNGGRLIFVISDDNIKLWHRTPVFVRRREGATRHSGFHIKKNPIPVTIEVLIQHLGQLILPHFTLLDHFKDHATNQNLTPNLRFAAPSVSLRAFGLA